MASFKEILKSSNHVIALTGAGISAESGVPTFRGSGGLWRTHRAMDLATPEAFASNPSRVWEFYSYRRELVKAREPNAAHKALAELERRMRMRDKKMVVITQNIDDLHRRAGSENVLELHGALFKTRCTKCGDVSGNHASPIVPGLEGKGSPQPDAQDINLPLDQLPQCKHGGCDGLLRPHVVWFGEPLDPELLAEVQKELNECDLCLVVRFSFVFCFNH